MVYSWWWLSLLFPLAEGDEYADYFKSFIMTRLLKRVGFFYSPQIHNHPF